MHRTPNGINGVCNGGEPGSAGATATVVDENGSLSTSKMREKLAALEDLNELLEEPVEEQVSLLLAL